MKEPNCVNPDAPTEKCAVCGTSVHTCEREVPENGDYRCPAHQEGAQLNDNRWVCSEECWDKAVGT